MKIRMPETYYRVKKYLKHNNEITALYEEQRAKNEGRKVQYWNWWEDERTAYWLEQFMESRGLLRGTDKTIALCSVFGEREVLERVSADVKIFFSGENLHLMQWIPYSDGLLRDKDCRLSIGFDCYENTKYLRFPLWLTYVFKPTLDETRIREQCEQLRYPEMGMRDKFACQIARADISGIRTAMYAGLSEVGKVDCPSGLFHNDDSLKEKCGDDKIAYMKQYIFNICPENSNAYGYCTEKVFEAIAAGCVPVYWGNFNQPEPNILNQKAIIFWDRESNGAKAIAQIKELCTDKRQLEAFKKQPRLVLGAEEYVIAQFRELESRLRKLIDE